MNNFKNNKRFGGNSRSNRGGGRSGGRSFGKPSFGGGRDFKRSGGRDSGRNFEMHQATCSECGKSCEVPFRPSGDKPVYCNDCFGGKGGQQPSDSFSKRAASGSSGEKFQNNDRNFDELKKQLEFVNTKLDTLISLAASFTQIETRTIAASEAVSDVDAPKKKSVKKITPKKK